MQEPYIYETFETFPAQVVITVTKCSNCPFHQNIDGDHEACTHPEVEPDEPDQDIPCKTFNHELRVDGYERIPTWCPMRTQVSTTTVQIKHDA